MFPGLDVYSACTDPVQYLIRADAGCAVDDLNDLDDDLSEVCVSFSFQEPGKKTLTLTPPPPLKGGGGKAKPSPHPPFLQK